MSPTVWTSRPTLWDRTRRLVFRIGFPLASLWWRIRRATHTGALVAVYVGDDLLLVRSSYRPQWNFPGGGVNAGETPEGAAKRELMEEVCLTAETLTPVGIFRGLSDGRNDVVHLFELRLDRLPELTVDGSEITGARMVPLGDVKGLALTSPVAAYLSWTERPSRA